MMKRILAIVIFMGAIVPLIAMSNELNSANQEPVTALLQQAEKFLSSDNKKAKVYLDSASLYLVKKHPDKAAYAEYCYLSSVYYLTSADFDKSIDYSSQACKSFKKAGNFKRVADCYFVMGRNHINNASFHQGISELLKASAIYDSLKLEKTFIKVQTDLGRGFYCLKDFKKAKEYFNKVKTYADSKHDTASLLVSLNNLGIICDETGGNGNDEAMNHYRRALKICEITKNEIRSIGISSNLGYDYFIRGKSDSAFILFKKAMALALKHNRLENQINLSGNIARYYDQKQMYDSAIYFVDHGLKMQEKSSVNMLKKELLLLKSEIWNNQGKYREAYRILQESNRWQDSLYNEQILKTTSELEAKFESQKKEQQLEMQEKEIESQKLQTRLLYIVLGLLVLLILSSGYYLHRIAKANTSLKQKNQTINQTNLELQEAIKTRDKLTSIIAHDIRNPLSSIIGFTQLSLEKEDHLDDELRQFLELSLSSSQRLNDLLENLLQWSRMQSHGMKVNPEEFSIGESIGNILALLQQMAESKQIDIQNLCDDSLTVKADRQMLNTIFRNILTNAIKFTDCQGSIKISSSVKQGFIQINIQDTGIGISPENISKLFDANADRLNLSKASDKGTGLGLLICNDFIKLNNGYINVTSEEGKGSCFSVYIPQGLA